MDKPDHFIHLSPNNITTQNNIRGVVLGENFYPLFQPRFHHEIPDEVISGDQALDSWITQKISACMTAIQLEMKPGGYIGWVKRIFSQILNAENADTQFEIGADIVYFGPECKEIIDPC